MQIVIVLGAVVNMKHELIMFHLVYRQLIYNPLHTIFMCLAIAVVISVILVLDGFQEGLYKQLRNTVMDRGSDLILTQAGISNLIAARSTIPQLTRLDVEDIPGVKVANPLTGISVIYEQDGRKNPVFILVYDKKGGPLELRSGNYIDEPREIIIDTTLAKLYDLSPGDPFILTDFEFKVAGVSKNTAAFFTPFAFINFDDLVDYYLESDIAADIATFPLLSYLLVELEPKAEPLSVAKTIEKAVPDVDVFLPDALAKNDVQLGHELFGPILKLLISTGYLIGLLAVSIVLFTTTHARKRSLGVMRALGFSIKKVAGIITLETAILILIAFPVGAAIAQLVAIIIPWFAPVYLVLPTEPITLFRTLLACIVFSLLGSFIAIHIINRVEPDIVFKS